MKNILPGAFWFKGKIAANGEFGASWLASKIKMFAYEETWPGINCVNIKPCTYFTTKEAVTDV